MSLINEALKKAQQLRNDEAAAQSGKVLPPGVSMPSRPRASIGAEDSSGRPVSNLPAAAQHPVYGAAQRGGARGRQAKSKVPLLIGASVVVIAAVVWFQVGTGKGERPVSERPAVVVVAPASVTTETAGSVALTAVAAGPEVNRSGARSDVGAEEPAASGGASAAPVVGRGTGTAMVRAEQPVQSAEIRPAVTPTASEPASVVFPVIAPATATSAGVADVAEASGKGEGSPETLVASLTEVVRPAEPVAVVLSADEAVLRYLERVRVTGVRVSGTDSKVLMNDRVYRLNEMVDVDLQLRVVAIAPRELHFRDRHGYDYKKTF